MSSVVRVLVHTSQAPDQVRRDLLTSLATRQVNHKFHYDSVKQAQQWLQVHERYSPARTDSECQQIYENGFARVVAAVSGRTVHVVGLGCGGGQKDAGLLERLAAAGKSLAYVPVDVSVAMVLVARQRALRFVKTSACCPVVLDLQTTSDLDAVLEEVAGGASPRVLTFFGMMPNFVPGDVLPKVAALLRRGDFLLVSANLAPGPDYAEGTRAVLPLYDNPETRAWLLMFLRDLGFEAEDGRLRVEVERCPHGSGLLRIAVYFDMLRQRTITLDPERIDFLPGESIRLFFSYRHTRERLRRLVGQAGLEVAEDWITRNGEEGVFLCQRS